MPTKYKKLEKILKALANGRRLTIIRFIQDKKKTSVGRIAEELKLSFKATSKHLGLLTAAEILSKEQKSSYMLFEINPELPDAARKIISLL
jgi:DNA-binding transcriptional ArsR family regulator